MEPCPCDYFFIGILTIYDQNYMKFVRFYEKHKICVTFVTVDRLYSWKLVEIHLLLLVVYG